jgi:hypothetical protein
MESRLKPGHDGVPRGASSSPTVSVYAFVELLALFLNMGAHMPD